MNLIESYKELYTVCETLNHLRKEGDKIEKSFANIEIFLRHNQSDIKKYGLISDISTMFRNNEFSVTQIEKLIRRKREEEINRENQRKELEEAERRKRENEERRRREQEERERQRRIEEERRRREQEAKNRKRKIVSAKWGAIILLVIIITPLAWWLILPLAGVSGYFLFQNSSLRKKVANYIANDWKIIIGR